MKQSPQNDEKQSTVTNNAPNGGGFEPLISVSQDHNFREQVLNVASRETPQIVHEKLRKN